MNLVFGPNDGNLLTALESLNPVALEFNPFDAPRPLQ
jgi:hypothetical protein